MAKLDGIKVVNENTVEYNGFVYALVTGDAQVHDLAKALDNGLDITSGAFYLVTQVDSDGDITFVDNANDNHCVNNDDDYWKVFRKSHAITIDNLTDAEGVVTITLPDGTKLEGTPSDLEKITRSMQALQAEHVAAVEMPEEAVEVEDASEPVAERLQVGDYAKVIEDGPHGFEEDDVVRIYDIVDYGSNRIRGEYLSGKRIGCDYFFEHELVKATDAEVQMAIREAKQALLKEGDFARVISNEVTTEACGPHEFEIGTVLKLHEFDSDDNTFETRYLNGDEPDAPWVHRKDLEPLTKEEAEHIAREAEEEKKAKAEREKWAVIGREVGELRDGDVVQFTESTGTSDFPEGSVAIITNVNGDEFNFGESDVYDGDSDWVKLIVPVEQRFDTVG